MPAKQTGRTRKPGKLSSLHVGFTFLEPDFVDQLHCPPRRSQVSSTDPIIQAGFRSCARKQYQTAHSNAVSGVSRVDVPLLDRLTKLQVKKGGIGSLLNPGVWRQPNFQQQSELSSGSSCYLEKIVIKHGISSIVKLGKETRRRQGDIVPRRLAPEASSSLPEVAPYCAHQLFRAYCLSC